MSAPDHGARFLAESVSAFRALKDLGDRALAQAGDDAFFARLDDGSNSLAVLVAHVGGTALSRWTDFLTTDGEKPTRDRDGEFDLDPRLTRAELMQQWEGGWRALFAALQTLTAPDLDRTITIRSGPHSVMQAILLHLRHSAYHVGQIVQLAKHYRGTDWQTLSAPKGQSRRYDRGPRS